MPKPEDPTINWRILALTTCTLTVTSILLFLNSHHFCIFDRRKNKSKRRFHSTLLNDDQNSMIKSAAYLNNANMCLDYAVGAGGGDEFDDIKYVVKQICSDWKDAASCEISVKIIVGGITNRLYRLVWESKSVLVRVYGDHTEKFIDRDVENKLFAFLAKRGFAPTYYGRFKNGRIEGWLDARPLEPQEMGQTQPTNYLQMIGRELGTMHLMDIPGDRTPLLWTKMMHFGKLALEIKLEDPVKNTALVKLNLAGLHQNMQWLMSVLPSNQNNNGKDFVEDVDLDEISKQAVAFASDVVFSHNDLLSGNILHNRSWDRVQIIDYEYGGYNFRGFDFANHFCENCGFELTLALYPSIQHQFAFFKAYMSTAAPEMLAQLEANRESNAFFHALYDVVNRYALASHLLWGFWALVQAAHSKIDFDFLQYATKRFNAFDLQRDFFITSTK